LTSPILDLSYRNYDGPMEPPSHRWWAIAKVSILSAFRKKSFWVLTVVSGLWYGIVMIIFYFADNIAGGIRGGGGGDVPSLPDATASLFNQVHWNEIFLHAFSRAQLWYFAIALLIGVGTIANDMRANALLVYLSKPCTKLDYIIGKWVGIFVPITIAAAIPAFFFYGYCFMSYRSNGFLHDPWLFARLIPLVIAPGIFYASLSLGISSMFKQGRVAGATFAGLFFFTYFFTVAMGGLHFSVAQSGSKVPVVDTLYYASVDGVMIGLAKDILRTDGSQPVPFMPAVRQFGLNIVPPPNGVLFGVILLGLCAASIALAWSRVRAVEVVG
jgi:ABC-2 type transport system permease protein